MPAPSISQTQTTHRFNSGVLPQFSATGSGGNIAWTADVGSFSPATTANGVSTTYTPANQSETVTITGTDTSDSATATVVIEIQGTLMYQPDWSGTERELDKRTTVDFAEDGSPDFLEKGPIQRTWKFAANNRGFDEWEDVEAFWIWHTRSKWWWYQDIPRAGVSAGTLYKVRFDSLLNHQAGQADFHAYSFVMREAIDV